MNSSIYTISIEFPKDFINKYANKEFLQEEPEEKATVNNVMGKILLHMAAEQLKTQFDNGEDFILVEYSNFSKMDDSKKQIAEHLIRDLLPFIK